MKYKDYKGSGIMVLLSKMGALPFVPSDDVPGVEAMFTLENNNKVFGPSIATLVETSQDLTAVALSLKLRYADKWKKLYDSYTLQYPANEATTTTYTGTSGYDNTGTTKNGTTNKVSAYDSEDLLNDTSQDTNSNTTQTNKANQSYTTTTTDNRLINDTISRLHGNVIYDIMYSDVRNYLFTTVYKGEC